MTFLSPVYLLGLVAVAVPVIIHLFYRRKVRSVLFPSLMLLRELVKRYSARQRLHELLVLLLRCSAVALLALALAKPALRGGVASASAAVASAIILDDTYSMGYRKGAMNRIARAKEVAEAILRTLGRRDSVSVLLLSAPDTPMSASPPSLIERIRGVDISYKRPSLKDCVQRALSFLKGADQLNRELYIIGDMQEKTYKYLTTEEFRNDCGSDVQVVISDVGGDEAVNAAVVDAKPIQDFRYPDRICVEAEVRNFSERSLTVRPQLLYGKRKRQAERLSLKPRAKETIRLYLPVSSVNRDVGACFIIDGDGLDVDNCWHFRLGVPRRIRVLLVNGDPSQLPEMDEVFYIRFALAPVDPKTGGLLSDIEPLIVPFFRLDRYRLSEFHILILANVGSLSASSVKRLTEFVKNGGGLIIFCGERIRIQHYNGWLSKLAGIRLLQKTSHNAPLTLETVDYTHPIFRSLASVASFSVPLVRFWRTVNIGIVGEGTNIVATYSNGEPAVVEGTFGRGRIVVVASTCDRDWTNLPVRSVFLPFVQALVHYCAGERDGRESFSVGDEVRTAVREKGVVVELPDGERRKMTARIEGDERFIRFIAATPGIYTIHDGERTTIIGVNAERDESDMKRLHSEALPKGDNIHYIDSRTDVASFIERLRTGVKLWDYFLVTALLLLFLELLLSNIRLPSFRREDER